MMIDQTIISAFDAASVGDQITVSKAEHPSMVGLLDAFIVQTMVLTVTDVSASTSKKWAVTTNVLELTNVPAQFSILSQGASAELQIMLPADWRFNHSFQGLPQSYRHWDSKPGLVTLGSCLLDDLTFDTARMSASTDAASSGVLQFSGELVTGLDLEILAGPLGLNENPMVIGELAMSGASPVIHLQVLVGAEAETVAIGPLELKNAGFQIRTGQAENGTATVLNEFVCSIFIDGVDDPIKIGAEYFELAKVLRLRATFSDAFSLANGLNGILSLVQSEHTDLQLPRALSFLGSLHLDDFVTVVELDRNFVRHVQFTVKSPESATWDIASGVSIRDLSLDLTILAPFESGTARSISAAVHGILSLGSDENKVSFDIAARTHHGFEVEGHLVEGEVVHLSRLVGALLDAPSTGIPEIDITFLNVLVRSTGDLSLQVDLKIWNLGDIGNTPVVIDSLGGAVARAGGAVSGSLKGSVSLGGTTYRVTADFPEGDVGFEFSGGAKNASGIPIGEWIDRMGEHFGVGAAPESIAGLTIQDVSARVNTKTKDVSFHVEVKMPVGDEELDAKIDFTLTRANGGYELKFKGVVLIGEHQFEFDADKGAAGTLLVGSWASLSPNGEQVGIRELFTSLPSVHDAIPDGLSINVQDMFLAYSKASISSGEDAPKGKFLFGIDLGAGVDLSKLPLVGKAFSGDSLKVDQLKLLVASSELTAAEVTSINTHLPAGAKVPIPQLEEGATNTVATLSSGPAVSANITWSGKELPVFMGAGDETSSNGTGGGAQSNDTSSSGNKPSGPKWFKVDRSFGPVHLGRVGVEYEDKVLGFLLDGDLSAGGVTLSLMGLSVDSPITEFKPQFGLQGLGLDIDRGTVKISGAFMHDGDSYAGTALISLEKLTLGAMGAYTTIDGHPSLFVYAVLDMPIGGPAFFFVTGLAAGFGFNRALHLPTIDRVAEFPLVQAAVSGVKDLNPSAALRSLQEYIPPSYGDQFFCIGIKFSSFKLIDSFALLAVRFGNQTEIALLGLSTLVVPTPEVSVGKDPLAVVQLGLKASYIPSEGTLKVGAQLTSASYIISKDCHLSGGFAFYSWFGAEHTGDFVLTLGGYHPHYSRPAHYPKVPRLAINWQVTSNLSIKADAYFALTPSALMAGGHLNAVYHSGSIKAWFKAGADFLIAWKPYHYEAHVYVEVGVSYSFTFFGRHTISAHVGADLQIWGPEFAGVATVHLWIVDFDVRFGPSKNASKAPISWESFQTMLPAQKMSVAVGGGLVSAGDGPGHLGVVNPKELALTLESVIPISRLNGKDYQAFGRAPMDERDARNELTLTVTRDGEPFSGLDASKVITKNQPAALWGNSGMKGTGSELVSDLLCGVSLTAPLPAPPDQSKELPLEEAMYDTEVKPAAFGWEDHLRPSSVAGSIPKEDLGFADWQVNLDSSYEDELLEAKHGYDLNGV